MAYFLRISAHPQIRLVYVELTITCFSDIESNRRRGGDCEVCIDIYQNKGNSENYNKGKSD